MLDWPPSFGPADKQRTHKAAPPLSQLLGPLAELADRREISKEANINSKAYQERLTR